jgi:magnesium transporter
MNSLRKEAESESGLTAADVVETWRLLAPEDRLEAFLDLPRTEAEDFFLELSARDQYELLASMPKGLGLRRSWMRLLPPDDAADLIQEVTDEVEREELLEVLDDQTRREVLALLAYSEDHAGGLMNPRYARVRPDASADEAIRYLQRQAREVLETIYYVYVIDADQKLLGVVSFRDLFAAASEKPVRELMATELVTAREDMDQEELARLFAQHDLQAIPVVDAAGHMKGIVTVDDIVDVLREEATEDIQKIGGTQALDAPYLEVSVMGMVKKRVGWLAALFIGEMLTTNAMSRFENEIARAVVLAIFVPLIISSGGNSGSQATTLVIRAMALGEVKLVDWWRVIGRELSSGLIMGLLLGAIAFFRIEGWNLVFPGSYGPHHLLISFVVGLSVVGIVTWGTVAGSMLPFLLRLVRLDPASASAPFVATLVDVTGIVLYFTAASLILRGALL